MRKILSSIVLLGGLYFAGAMIGSAQEGWQQPADSTGLPNNEWKRGLAISPVSVNLNGRDKRMVGLGSYIVNARAGCADCHTSAMHTQIPAGNLDLDPSESPSPYVNLINVVSAEDPSLIYVVPNRPDGKQSDG